MIPFTGTWEWILPFMDAKALANTQRVSRAFWFQQQDIITISAITRAHQRQGGFFVMASVTVSGKAIQLDLPWSTLTISNPTPTGTCVLCSKTLAKSTWTCSNKECALTCCTSCSNTWLRTLPSCPGCAKEAVLLDKMECSACSHDALQFMFQLLYTPPGRHNGANWFDGSGVRASKQRATNHNRTQMHQWCIARWVLLKPNSKIRLTDEAKVSWSTFVEEYTPLKSQMTAAGHDIEIPDFKAEVKNACVVPDSNPRPQSRPATLSTTAVFLKMVYQTTKNLRTMSVYEEMMQVLNMQFGPHLPPEREQATHTGYAAGWAGTRAISRGLHLQLLSDIRTKANELTDGKNVMSICDPIAMKMDGYSRGPRTMDPILFKKYIPGSLKTMHALFRLPETYGWFTDDTLTNGVPMARDATGSGLVFTLLHALRSTAFPECTGRELVGTLKETPLTISEFASACVAVAFDNGGGMIKGEKSLYSLLKKYVLPDIGGVWCPGHHLQRIFIRLKDDEGCTIIRESLERVEEIAKFTCSPKRHWYFVGQTELFGVNFTPMKMVAEQRWVPSSRTLMQDFIDNLPALRLGLDQMLKNRWWQGQSKSGELQERVQKYIQWLTSHKFLYSIHYWRDVLEVEAWATKSGGEGAGCAVTLGRMLLKLPLKARALQNLTACKSLTKYLKSITEGRCELGLQVHHITAYTKVDKNGEDNKVDSVGSSSVVTTVVTTDLTDYAADSKALLAPIKTIGIKLAKLVTEEMPGTTSTH